MKTRFLMIVMLIWGCFAGKAQNNIRLQVAGPEDSYNMVRVINQTHYTDFSCTVYFLIEKDGKMCVESALGAYHLKETGDIDSNKVRTRNGQWLGVALPEEMSGVSVNLMYKDMPLFDIVDIILTEESGVTAGEEF